MQNLDKQIKRKQIFLFSFFFCVEYKYCVLSSVRRFHMCVIYVTHSLTENLARSSHYGAFLTLLNISADPKKHTLFSFPFFPYFSIYLQIWNTYIRERYFCFSSFFPFLFTHRHQHQPSPPPVTLFG